MQRRNNLYRAVYPSIPASLVLMKENNAKEAAGTTGKHTINLPIRKKVKRESRRRAYRLRPIFLPEFLM